MTLSEQPNSLILLDDHPMILEGLVLFLKKCGFDVAGTATTVGEVGPLLEKTSPQLLIADLLLGHEDAVVHLTEWKKRRPGVKILVYSMFDRAFHVERSFAAGADAYVHKSEPPSVLLAAIRAVQEGRNFVSPCVRADATQWFSDVKWRSQMQALSSREWEVLSRLSGGATSGEVAEGLHLSRKTVESYLARLKEKLGLATTREVVKFAVSHAADLSHLVKPSS